MNNFKIGDKVRYIGIDNNLGFYNGKIYTIKGYSNKSWLEAMGFLYLEENKEFFGRETEFILAEKKKNPTYSEILKKLNVL